MEAINKLAWKNTQQLRLRFRVSSVYTAVSSAVSVKTPPAGDRHRHETLFVLALPAGVVVLPNETRHVEA